MFIDGLRGLAAIAVVSYHFYVGSPLRGTLAGIFPKPFILLLEEGRLGVEVFFVISGFVIAYSLRKTAANSQNLKRFICRFLIRLTPSYWVTIFLTVIINLTSNFVITDRIAPIPNLEEVVAHLFYLQNLFKYEQIVPVFWTLCFEVRFYFLFATLLVLLT
nr:acyltransferase [Leptolyngbya sp. FACHB-541]